MNFKEVIAENVASIDTVTMTVEIRIDVLTVEKSRPRGKNQAFYYTFFDFMTLIAVNFCSNEKC